MNICMYVYIYIFIHGMCVGMLAARVPFAKRFKRLHDGNHHAIHGKTHEFNGHGFNSKL